jgi:branched-chain amino acid transport system ATP-binding protein
LTVEEHLLIPLRKAKRQQRKVMLEEIYELFPRLGERPKQRARTLSGGEKRMLALARGMLLGGSMILIDEPSLGLAPRLVEVVYDQIRKLSERGIAVLIVEENPMRLKNLAASLHLLDRGVIIASGRTEEVLADKALLETYLGVTGNGGGSLKER